MTLLLQTFLHLFIIFQAVNIIQMGLVQTSEGTQLLYQNYQVVREENQMKILQDKKTKEQFILKELCFLNKPEYDVHFKRIRDKEKELRSLENTLKIVKLWSKEHNGVCSNLFKIYTVYEYPKVRLIDEIQARKIEEKPFQEVELISILQSCLNAFTAEPSHTNISPYLIFIIPEGILKLINTELADPHYHSVYNQQYYYSPQKMLNFQSIKFNVDQTQKQAVFSMGMTILHSALLQSPSICYEVSSKRLNKKKLQHFKMKLSKKYSNSFVQFIFSLLEWDPAIRLGFHQVQTLINEICNQPHYINSFCENNQENNNIKEITSNQFILSLPTEKNKKQQTSSEQNVNISELTLSTYVNQVRKSEFEIICDQTRKNSIKTELIPIQKNESNVNKQNIFTDSRILNMIKQGLSKIQQAAKQRSALEEKQNNNIEYILTKPTPVASSQDLLSQYELKTSSTQKDCIYVVQKYEDQSIYQGITQNGMKNGHGKLIYPDGVFYEGNFKNDALSGHGSLYYGTNRPAYVGNWQNNKFNGFGTLYNQYPTKMDAPFDYSDFNKIEDKWIKFQGNFNDDIKEGLGKIILTNGQQIQAIFNLGVINGQGTFKDMNGRKIRGKWSGNQLLHLIQ